MPDSGADSWLIALVLASMGIQLAAAAQAIRLIHITERHLAWIFIALACCLQAARRGITLAGLFIHGSRYPAEIGDQFMGLAISAGMFAGVTLIAPIFFARGEAERELRSTVEEKNRIIGELRAAMEKINLLSGLLPICSYCKRIRNDQGYWEQVESYIRNHSTADFSHGICPECLDKAMRELEEAGCGTVGDQAGETRDGEGGV